MIQKIQKYLLENYPLLWNIRIFPLLLVIIIANLIFFGIGYLSTDNTFDKGYYYDFFFNSFATYFASFVIGVLILIGWLIHYMRNNAFRVYYPRKTIHIYLEWILCFIICVGIIIIPLSLTEGCNKKWRAACSKKNTKKALEIIDQAEMLIPRDIYDYKYEMEHMEPIRIPDGMSVNLDSSNIDQYAYNKDSKNNLIIKGYIGTSLLFYTNDYTYNYESEPPTMILTEKGKKREEVKSWLKNGEQDKIKALMGEYMELLEKHKITTNLTIDSWFDRIYHPPFFPVDSSSFIYSEESYSGYYDYKGNYHHNKSCIGDNYDLKYGYNKILDNYENTDTIRYMLLVCLCVSLAISILIFSCRVTNVKKWLQAIVWIGVLFLLVSLLTSMEVLTILKYQTDSLFAIPMFSTWIVLFIAILIYGLNKINNKEYKGRSNILINIFLWLIPCLLPLFLFIIYPFRFLEFDNYWEFTFWINIPFTIIFMGFASIFIRKWKGLPDQ